jgi:hypothetical protein
LKISTDEPLALRPKIEGALVSQNVLFVARDISNHELEYDIRIPIDESTEKVERELGKVLPENPKFSWQRKKDSG